MTQVEVTVKNRAVNLPLIGDVSRGTEETLKVDQLDAPTGDLQSDLATIANSGVDMETLFGAVNSALVSAARSEWFEQNSVSVEKGSAIDSIRTLMSTFQSVGMSEDDAMRNTVAVPEIYAACVIDGIDPDKALSESQIAACRASLDENKKVVLAKRKEIADAKAKAEAEGKKRGRPAKS